MGFTLEPQLLCAQDRDQAAAALLAEAAQIETGLSERCLAAGLDEKPARTARAPPVAGHSSALAGHPGMRIRRPRRSLGLLSHYLRPSDEEFVDALASLRGSTDCVPACNNDSREPVTQKIA